MDHMRISGRNVMQKMPKQAKAKRDGVINPQNYNLTQKNWMLSKRYGQTEVTVELGYMCPRDSLVHQY